MKKYQLTQKGRKKVIWLGFKGTLNIGFHSYELNEEASSDPNQIYTIDADPEKNEYLQTDGINLGLIEEVNPNS